MKHICAHFSMVRDSVNVLFCAQEVCFSAQEVCVCWTIINTALVVKEQAAVQRETLIGRFHGLERESDRGMEGA